MRLNRRSVMRGLAGAGLAGGLAGVTVPSGRAGAVGETISGPAELMAQYRDYRRSMEGDADYLPDVERALWDAVAEYRADTGVPPLEREETLVWIARFYAHRMGVTGRFDHVDQSGRTPDERLAILHRRHAGPNGENLFLTDLFRRSEPVRAGRLAADSLMNSPGHRDNMLKPDWTHAAMGVVTDGEVMRVVQLFLRRDLLLAGDVPLALPKGAPLPVEAATFAVGTAAQVGLVPPDGTPTGADFMPLDRARTPAEPGIRRLHYARPTGREGRVTTYAILPGPMVEVVRG